VVNTIVNMSVVIVIKIRNVTNTRRFIVSDQQGQLGATGLQGLPGIASNTGATGPTGNDGPQGPTGNNGDIGPQGPTGNDGATGPQGPTGNDGATGPQGLTGNDGATGPQGPTGSNLLVGFSARTDNNIQSGATGYINNYNSIGDPFFNPGAFDDATGTFTVPYTGIYQINVNNSITFFKDNDQNEIIFSIVINGNTIIGTEESIRPDINVLSGYKYKYSIILKLNTVDTLNVYYYNMNSKLVIVSSNFSVALIAKE